MAGVVRGESRVSQRDDLNAWIARRTITRVTFRFDTIVIETAEGDSVVVGNNAPWPGWATYTERRKAVRNPDAAVTA